MGALNRGAGDVSAHKHTWRVGYVPGDGYRFCACGKVETVGPSGTIGKASASLIALVRRNHNLKVTR